MKELLLLTFTLLVLVPVCVFLSCKLGVVGLARGKRLASQPDLTSTRNHNDSKDTKHHGTP